MSVRRSASGAGVRRALSSLARMKRSMGDRAQVTFLTVGIGGRLTGCSDHQLRPARLSVVKRKGSMGSLPHLAPLAIHDFKIAFSEAESGFLGGISSSRTRCQRSLVLRVPA